MQQQKDAKISSYNKISNVCGTLELSQTRKVGVCGFIF